MKNKKELEPTDYVKEKLISYLEDVSEDVCLECAIKMSFFILGKIILDTDEPDFREMISLIEEGEKPLKKPKNKRKAG